MRIFINRARILAGIMGYKLFNIRKPVVAYLLLTNKCNLKCRYCFVECNKSVKQDLTLEEWKKIIEELKKMGAASICMMGGEPLLFSGLEELTVFSKDLGLNIDMTTNGLNIEKKLDAVKNIDSFMLSLDGPKEHNDINRGSLSYAAAINALRVLKEMGKPVRLNCVITKQTRNDLSWILNFIDAENVWATFSLPAEFPENSKMLEKEIVLSDEDTKEYYEELYKQKKMRRKILFSKQTIKYIIDYPRPYREIIWKDKTKSKKDFCLFGQVMFYINSDGAVYPCATMWNTDQFRPKYIREHGLKEAIENASRLNCHACSCPGVPEWKNMGSIKSIISGIEVTLSQLEKK